MKNETLNNTPKLFPIGTYASEATFKDFFPLGRHILTAQKTNQSLSKELDIMKKYYLPTLQYSAFISELTSKRHAPLNVNALRVGMSFMHHAARIEAQTKKTQLPQITDVQLVSYLASQAILDLDPTTHEVTNVYYEPVLEQFQDQEPNVNRVLSRILENVRGIDSFKVGCAQMWDFLKIAPTLS